MRSFQFLLFHHFAGVVAHTNKTPTGHGGTARKQRKVVAEWKWMRHRMEQCIQMPHAAITIHPNSGLNAHKDTHQHLHSAHFASIQKHPNDWFETKQKEVEWIFKLFRVNVKFTIYREQPTPPERTCCQLLNSVDGWRAICNGHDAMCRAEIIFIYKSHSTPHRSHSNAYYTHFQLNPKLPSWCGLGPYTIHKARSVEIILVLLS